MKQIGTYQLDKSDEKHAAAAGVANSTYVHACGSSNYQLFRGFRV